MKKYGYPTESIGQLGEENSYSAAFEETGYLFMAIMAFFLPLFFGNAQLIVGPIVNCLLVLAAINLRSQKKLLFLIALPSIAAFLSGVIFGPQTAALLYLIPFIWMANGLFVFAFRKLFVKQKRNYFFSLAVASVGKASLLFGVAFALFSFSLVPVVFLTVMGMLQLATAVFGGLIAFPLNKILKKNFG